MRTCPDCGWPREAHSRVKGAPHTAGPPPHSGGRGTGSPQTRECALVTKMDPAAQVPVLVPDVEAYRKRLAAHEALRAMFREEADDERDVIGPHYTVTREAPRGSGFHGRFRPGERRVGSDA